jgi:hypothetical protein
MCALRASKSVIPLAVVSFCLKGTSVQTLTIGLVDSRPIECGDGRMNRS